VEASILMPTVKARKKGHPPKGHQPLTIQIDAPHPKNSRTFKFPFGPQELTVDSLPRNWTSVDRPGRFPLLLGANKQLRTLAFTLTVAHPLSNTSIDVNGYFNMVNAIAASAYIIRVKYNRMTVGAWRCTSCSVASMQLNPLNQPTQFTVDFTFTRASNISTPSGPVQGGHHPHREHKANKKGKRTKKKKHKVRRKHSPETLTEIALEHYDDPEMWREIADLNHITNPRKIKPGTVLNLPG
jgi:hypothetical protein